MKTVVKTVKQHSHAVKNIEELKTIARRYTTVKNYVYSRYSGINSLLILQDYKRQIRDKWVKTEFALQWKLPARYWKMALDEAVANIKTEWSNIRLRIKSAVFKNHNLTPDERHFILYVIKADSILYDILKYNEPKIPQRIEKYSIRKNYIYSLIRRYVRKYKGAVPYSHKASGFMMDADMYNYTVIDGVLHIFIIGLERGKRIEAVLKDKNFHNGNVRIMLEEDGTLEIHKAKTIDSERNWAEEKTIGIDKGYRCLIATSEGKYYGEELNKYLSKETERLNLVNAKRNKVWALMKKYESEGDTAKAENIRNNNFGKVKYNRQKNRFDAMLKSYINHELNCFINEDKPSEVISEDLSFVNWKDKYPAHIKRKLSRWIKGYIKERLEYKCSLNEISQTIVNAAYTSQVCHKCQSFGIRNNETFACNNCGTIDADFNASLNIKQRKFDEEITLYTPYSQVKAIILNRHTA